MKILIRLFLFCMLASNNLWSESTPITWYTLDANKQATIAVELFLSSTCSHCHKADDFFKSIEQSNPWLKVHRHVINNDKQALILFSQLLNQLGLKDFSVPSMFFCNSRWSGFATSQTSGRDLLQALKYCKQHIEKKGELTQNTSTVLQQQANSNKGVQIKEPSSIKTTLYIAAINLMYSCSIFCIMTFLSILFLQPNRKDQLLLGLLFIITLSLMHFFQQRHMGIYFTLLPWMRIPAALIGLLSVQVARLHYQNQVTVFLSYATTFLLALMIGLYQQTCSTNWFYLFEQWLTQHHFDAVQTAFYATLYHFTYVLPLLLVLILYLFLVNAKRLRAFKNRLRPLGMLFFVTIGCILIAYPFALSYLYTSYFILLLLPICAWLINRFYLKKTE